MFPLKVMQLTETSILAEIQATPFFQQCPVFAQLTPVMPQVENWHSPSAGGSAQTRPTSFITF